MHYWYILLYLILPQNGNASNLVCKKMEKKLEQTMFNQQCNKSVIFFKERGGTKSMSGEKGTKGEKGIKGKPGEVKYSVNETVLGKLFHVMFFNSSFEL